MKWTSDQLWKRIEELNWGGLKNNLPRFNADHIESRQKYGFLQFGMFGMKTLKEFAAARVGELLSAMREYEKKNRTLHIWSDDGLSDILWHVVGLGKLTFEENLKNPLLLEKRYQNHEYKESFSYVFHTPAPPKSKRQKQMDAFTVIFKKHAELRSAIRDAEKLSLEIDRLVTNLAADFQTT